LGPAVLAKNLVNENLTDVTSALAQELSNSDIGKGNLMLMAHLSPEFPISITGNSTAYIIWKIAESKVT
jgi:hypothetical protein